MLVPCASVISVLETTTPTRVPNKSYIKTQIKNMGKKHIVLIALCTVLNVKRTPKLIFVNVVNSVLINLMVDVKLSTLKVQ